MPGSWISRAYFFGDGWPPQPTPWLEDLGIPDQTQVGRHPEPDSVRIHRYFRGFWDADLSALFGRMFGYFGRATVDPFLNNGWDIREFFWLELSAFSEGHLKGETPYSPLGSKLSVDVFWHDVHPTFGQPGTEYSWQMETSEDPIRSTSSFHGVFDHQWKGPNNQLLLPAFPATPFFSGDEFEYKAPVWVPMSMRYPVDNFLPPRLAEEDEMPRNHVLLKTNGSTPSVSTGANVTFQAPVYDTGGWFNIAAPQNIVVPAGVTLIEGWGQARAGASANSMQVYFQKNGVNPAPIGLTNEKPDFSGAVNTQQCYLPPTVVAPGDIITLRVQKGSASLDALVDWTWAYVRSVTP